MNQHRVLNVRNLQPLTQLCSECLLCHEEKHVKKVKMMKAPSLLRRHDAFQFPKALVKISTCLRCKPFF